jgi:hypothetical protein
MIARPLADALDARLDADRAFFTSHPDRRYRVRPSFPEELAANARASGISVEVPPGWRWFTAVRAVAPGVRVRAFFAAEPALEPGTSEAAAAWRFNSLPTAAEAHRLAAALEGRQ